MMPRANPFWRFSLRTYREPGVQEACLALQDRCGADVNLLLFCGWIGRGGRVLDENSLRLAVGRVGHWQSEVVVPMRLARRGLKGLIGDSEIGGMATTLRRRALAIELELERVEQTMLAALAESWGEPAQRLEPLQAVPANLTAYLTLLGEEPGPQERRHQGAIAKACAS